MGPDTVEVSGQLLEATRQQVEQEMEGYVKKNLPTFVTDVESFQRRATEDPQLESRLIEREKWGYLNNWRCNLAGGFYRVLAERGNRLDVLGRDFFSRAKATTVESNIDAPSSRRLEETNREFWRIVDGAFEAEGLSLEEVRRVNEYLEGKFDPIAQQEFYRKTFPVYVRLKAMGYNWYDLSS